MKLQNGHMIIKTSLLLSTILEDEAGLLKLYKESANLIFLVS